MHVVGRLLITTSTLFTLSLQLDQAVADGDSTKGQQIFARCAACHAKDTVNRAGPGLSGIVGRHAGSVQGFRYSRAMKTANVVWDDKELDDFLAAPQKAVPGTVMPFAGISNSQERADLIAFLHTLK